MSRVLVVDDDRSVLFMLTEVLRDAGHDVLAASTSEQALTLFASASIDAALVDLHLHGECGEVLIRRLREDCATLPVILLTGDARHQSSLTRESGLEPAVGLDIMTKPLDIDELSQVLKRALARDTGCASSAQ